MAQCRPMLSRPQSSAFLDRARQKPGCHAEQKEIGHHLSRCQQPGGFAAWSDVAQANRAEHGHRDLPPELQRLRPTRLD